MKHHNRILVIDDEDINIDIIELLFHDDEHIQIDGVTSGIQAIEKAKENQYDSILLDVIMPEIDGLEVLKELRQIDGYKTTPILMITSDTDKKHEALSLGATDFIPKPFDMQELKLRLFNYLDYNRVLQLTQKDNLYLEDELANKIMELEEALDIARDSQYEIAYRLAKASEFRDIETGMHLQRMSLYSKELARLLGFSEENQEIILKASPLHDVGKIGIRDAILLKPAKFTPQEFEEMKTHSIIGGNILEGNDNFDILKYGRIIALQHHERVDGNGYPFGKKGDEIHPFARIVAIADVFDALTSPRVYKKAFTIEQSIKILKEGRSSHFDSQYLDVFLDNLDIFLDIKNKNSDTTEEY